MDLSINGGFLFLTTASSEIGTSLAILYPWSHFLPLCQSVLGQPHQPCLTGALTCVLPLLPHRLAFLHLSEHITFFLKRVGRLEELNREGEMSWEGLQFLVKMRNCPPPLIQHIK